MMTPIIRPMSPVRVVRNALIAASVFALLLPPVADQHERAEADELPADEQLQRVRRRRRACSIDAVNRLRARRRSRCSGGRRACTPSSRCARAARSSVTTNSIITASPSIWVPTPNSTPPFCHQVTVWMTGVTTASACSPPRRRRAPLPKHAREAVLVPPVASSTRWIHCDRGDARQHERRADRERCRSRSPCCGMRFPKKRMRTNETAGMRGDEPGVIEHRSRQPFSWSTSVEVGTAQVAVDEQHDREADADLGGGDRDHEQREDLARRPRVRTPRTRSG